MEAIKIKDKTIQYKKVYRRIRYPRLEFKTGCLVVILPENYCGEEKLLLKHKEWILKKVHFIEDALKEVKGLELNSNIDKATFTKKVEKIVKEFEKELDVKVNKIFFRKMKTKWGSCSSDGNITINKLLMFLPVRFIRYIVFHEILHTIHRKHNTEFYNVIKKKFKNSEKIEKELFSYWFLLVEREGYGMI
ncbi:MAG: M48 family metallopeptidase [Candidatus Ratteibacteria bacterium]|nr:M48 family metallopeptidase [Candidatus Ratteibacteria bacterium]